MAKIEVLDSNTIDKIAAGEVVEKPLSVVKELVENALDSDATAITVEIKGGGIDMIRVTDNGSGIEGTQVKNAFMRHATSKIRTVDDLNRVTSLGFRGEALSSIAAVAKVEVVTKTKDKLTGVHYVIEGAQERLFEEVGAPDGTTFIVRNLFFNTPVRRKFLKQATTEGGYIIELMEHIAMSRPDVSFKLMVNGNVRFHTSGNKDLKEVIYRIHGKEVSNMLVEIDYEREGFRIYGFLGKPTLNRSSRNFETYFVNGRYIKSNVIAKGIEEGYRQYLMQHKFPFVVLHFMIQTDSVDVNVHPTKMDVRFTEPELVGQWIADAVCETLSQKEMIPEAFLTEDVKEEIVVKKESTPEPFEERRTTQYKVVEEMRYEASRPSTSTESSLRQSAVWSRVLGQEEDDSLKNLEGTKTVIKAAEHILVEKPVQLDLFEEKMLDIDNRQQYKILGQIFDTYWIIAFKDKMFIVDQHAAHEKVKYERFMKQFHEKTVVSQSLNPPIILSLSGKEEQVLKDYFHVFAELGFEVEAFGGNEYALRAVPTDLYGLSEKEMFIQVLDDLLDNSGLGNFALVEEKIASMSCKAAVKGNHAMSFAEMETLIDELLTLDNPYNCPHGRPTIISMSKYEIEKKFKRIV
ncbi:MAG: DNA mismatch repair endonuclease MutL [Lachnospiraceae bacterium]|nr:DNA mismatch repair endonuclease MutL [Lachnospiraceae bacterium]